MPLASAIRQALPPSKPLPPLPRLGLAILGRRRGLETLEQARYRLAHLIHGAVEGGCVDLGRPGEARHLPHKLERGIAHLIRRRDGLEIEERADVAARGAEFREGDGWWRGSWVVGSFAALRTSCGS